jgi:hypothetical protein
MNLTGWQRVGVVISVLWALTVGGFAAYEITKGAPFGEFQLVEFVPDKSSAPIVSTYPISGKTVTLKPVESVLNIQALLLTIVGPIVSGWLLVYVLLWVYRWVRASFHAR